MFEMRAYIPHLGHLKNQLIQLGCLEKGEYAFRDDIYQPLDKTFDLHHEFMRVRVYHKTNCDQKLVELSHKVRIMPTEKGINVFKRQFDLQSETEPFLSLFQLMFSFERIGSEYQLGHLRIYVEEIEGLHPSIEALAPSQEDIHLFFKELGITQTIAESVPQLIYSLLVKK